MQSFAINAAPINGQVTFSLSAGKGAYTMAGEGAVLRSARTIAAGKGSISLTGTNTLLLSYRRMLAERGQFSLTGKPATLIYTRVYGLAVAKGHFVLTGRNATLRKGMFEIADERLFLVRSQMRSFSVSPDDHTFSAPQMRSFSVARDNRYFAVTGEGRA